MIKEIIANYVNKKREIKGLTISELATESKVAEGTVKNVCLKKAENPSMETMIPIMEVIDGSFDEMLYPEKYKERISSDSIVALMSAIRETNGEHVHDIRTHYNEHKEDIKSYYERIIDMQNEHIVKVEKSNKNKTKIIIALSSIFIALFFGLLILELLHPEHGWIRF